MISRTMVLYVRHFRLTCELANSYVACDGFSGEAWLIDVGEMSERLVHWVIETGVRLTGIFITHSHYDHNGGVAAYSERFPDVKVYGGSLACAGDRTIVVQGGEQLAVGETAMKVIALPGHTSDHLALYSPQDRVLFSGDALFAGSVGGTPSEAAKRDLITIIKEKVLSLPDGTVIYPGHGPPTTIGIERRGNPFFH